MICVPFSRPYNRVEASTPNIQKGNLSIFDYLLKIKTIVDELSAVGHSAEECDDGLPEEYDPVVMNIGATNLSDQVSVAYVHGQLLNMEMRIAHHQSSSSMPFDQTAVALFTPKNGTNTSYGHGGG